jgi:hypothetical protein
MWIVQDDGVEVGVGDRWDTRIEVSLADARTVSDPVPVGLELIGQPLSVGGPRYRMVGRVLEDDEHHGARLDVGALVVAPTSYEARPAGTLLTLQSELYAQPSRMNAPPDPLIRRWTVRQIFVRWWNAVPDDRPRSYRPDPVSVRFRPIDRMRRWEDGNNPDGTDRVIADYLLDLA